MDGTIAQPVPAVLGHEGAGEVTAVGGSVTDVAVGDTVAVVWLAPCRRCAHCLRGDAHLCTAHLKTAQLKPNFRLGPGHAFGMAGCGTWAEQTVLPGNGVVRVDPDVPFEVAAVLSCGVMTGVGAVLNTADVQPGSSVVVFGCGGVGMSVIQGARVAGAATIVGIDPVAAKHDIAARFGATHAGTPSDLATLMATTGARKGFDYAFDAVGSPTTIRAAWDVTRRGGMTVVVGAGRTDESVTFSPSELLFDGKQIRSSLLGSAEPRRDIARLVDLWRTGRLDVTGLVSHRFALDGINDGIARLRAGDAVRQVVVLD
jgi:S-(hydroxymethyl)glutathione dehydrogenase/alcohol dehydrogenase